MQQRSWIVRVYVMAEVLEGEAVIIDLASGRYHAASGVAATVWEAIAAGSSFSGILAGVERRHSALPHDAVDQIERFIGQLGAAGLVTEGDLGAADVPAGGGAAGLPTTPWVAPVLESHDDLEDLLLLDPVHEVTEAGWPHAAPPGA